MPVLWPGMASGSAATCAGGSQPDGPTTVGETTVSGHGVERGRRGVTRERRCGYWLGEGKLEEAGAAAVASLASGHGGHSRAQRMQVPKSEGERGREWSE